MVLAAETIRRQKPQLFGSEPISIGFWVGGGVTPNKFEEFNDNPDNPYKAKKARNLIYKQLLTCPFCGTPLREENFDIDIPKNLLRFTAQAGIANSISIKMIGLHCLYFGR